MSFEFVTKLPTPTEIKEQYPVPEEIKALKAERDAEIADVITGKSDKLLVIIEFAQQIMKLLSLITHQDLLRFRRRLKTKLLLFQEFILTSQELQE